MNLTEHIKRGTLVLASLDKLYLCPELGCRAVSNIAEECCVCGARNVLALAGLVDRRGIKPDALPPCAAKEQG